MEGLVQNALLNYLDQFTVEVLVILIGLLFITSTLFLWLWFANRKKYQNLKHQIPANVVNNYIDSIIQNSSALKSGLFRGDVQGNGNPAVMNPIHLDGIASGSGDLNAKNAEISALMAQLNQLKNSQRDLENKFAGSQAEISSKTERIIELEKALNGKGGTPVGADPAELKKVTKERDDLKEKLKEFEIISEDLANIKKLQQENIQLKKSLGVSGAVPTPELSKEAPQEIIAEKIEAVADIFEEMSAPAPAPESIEQGLEEFLSPPAEEQNDSDPAPEIVAATPEETKPPGPDKTPEDLLSEFEKMLG
jgi:hypothetical protein